MLARLLTRHGNRVGALLYGDQRRHRDPGAQRPPPRAAPAAPHADAARDAARAAAETDLRELLRAAYRVVPRRSLVFVVSDFISAPGWAEPLAHLAQRHEVVAVRLYDPLEMALPDLGLLVMQDAETGEQLFVDTHDRGFRRRFAAAADGARGRAARAFAPPASTRWNSSTDDDLVDAILRFADLRKRRSRLAAGGGLPRTSGRGSR